MRARREILYTPELETPGGPRQAGLPRELPPPAVTGDEAR